MFTSWLSCLSLILSSSAATPMQHPRFPYLNETVSGLPPSLQNGTYSEMPFPTGMNGSIQTYTYPGNASDEGYFDNLFGPHALSNPGCIPTPQPRILSWDSFINYVSRPNKNWPWRHDNYGDIDPITYIPLELSGDGFVWVEDEHSDAPFFSLFQNSQKWKLINCTDVFAEADIEMGACTSGDLGIYYNITDLDEGESVYDRGMIGTLDGIVYPQRSAWSVYQLRGLSVTPIPEFDTPVGEDFIVEIRAWDETGAYRGMEEFKIIGGEATYRLELEASIFRSVIAWQIHVRRDVDGELAVTDYMSVIIDDVDIVEFLYDAKWCPYGEPDHAATFRTIDLTQPTLPDGYTFSPNTTYYSVYDRAAARAAARHRRDKNKQVTTPKGYYSVGQIDIIGLHALFEPFSVKIRIDTSTLPENVTLRDLSLATETHVTSYDRHKGAFFHTPLGHEENHVVFEHSWEDARGMNKLSALQLMPVPIVGYWIEEIVVLEWNEWPGTYRCGHYHRALCEWPLVRR